MDAWKWKVSLGSRWSSGVVPRGGGGRRGGREEVRTELHGVLNSEEQQLLVYGDMGAKVKLAHAPSRDLVPGQLPR